MNPTEIFLSQSDTSVSCGLALLEFQYTGTSNAVHVSSITALK